MRKLSAIRNEIRSEWSAIVARSGVHPEALGALPKLPKLLGTGTKTEAGEGLGILTAVVYMAPATEAFPDGRTLCPFATEGCASACLGHSAGRMVFGPMKLARLWKTALYMGARALFFELAEAEARAHAAKAERKGYRAAIRIDGSTDTGAGRELARRLPGVTFYDYTKVPARALGAHPANYHVTFSYTGRNWETASAALAMGRNVAVVFPTRKGEAFPPSFRGFPVLDGDKSDARFLDSPGHVVGLSFKAAKGRAKALEAAQAEGFVVSPELEAA